MMELRDCTRACWLLGWQAGVNDGENQRRGTFDASAYDEDGAGLYAVAGIRLAFALERLSETLALAASEGYVVGFIQATEQGPVDGPADYNERYSALVEARLLQEYARLQQMDDQQ